MNRDSEAAPTQENGRRLPTSPVAPTVDAPRDTTCPTCGHDVASCVPRDELDIAALAAFRAERERFRSNQRRVDEYLAAFADRWGDRGAPATWRRSVKGIRNAGLPKNVMLECVDVALDAHGVPAYKRFAYFCGVAWHRIRELEGYAIERALREAT